MAYSYKDAMLEDIKQAYKEHKEWHNIPNSELRETMNDELWVDDSVTGNASGSYTCNTGKAKEYVVDNIDLWKEACEEFCISSERVGESFLNEDWEWIDVTIRCYMLSSVIDEFLDNVRDEMLDK